MGRGWQNGWLGTSRPHRALEIGEHKPSLCLFFEHDNGTLLSQGKKHSG